MEVVGHKRIKTSKGWITRTLKASSPMDLMKADFMEIWEAGDGRRFLIREMETSHIVNVISMLAIRLEKTYQKLYPKPGAVTLEMLADNMFPIRIKMRAEIQRRLGVPEKPAPAAGSRRMRINE